MKEKKSKNRLDIHFKDVKHLIEWRIEIVKELMAQVTAFKFTQEYRIRLKELDWLNSKLEAMLNFNENERDKNNS